MAPSRQIARPHCLGRKRGIAEIDGPPSGAEEDARDPKPPWGRCVAASTEAPPLQSGDRGGVPLCDSLSRLYEKA